MEIILVVILLGVILLVLAHYFRGVSVHATPVSCIANLKMIDGAKQQWAVETKQLPTAVPAFSDLVGPNLYLRSLPRCPQGGIYSLNAVSVSPTCSKSGAPDFHTL